MKAEYKRDLNNNYLILELEQERETDGYALRMAEQNEIKGLLKLHSIKRDGIRYLHYEITSRQPLEGIYERKVMNYQDILNILNDIREVMENMQKYLLNPAHLIFIPEYIFVGADHRAAFCYFPEAEKEESIISLAEFILKKLDHEDTQAVVLGYRFYQSVCKENFSVTRVWKELVLTGEAGEEGFGSTVKNAQTETEDQYELEKEAGEPESFRGREYYKEQEFSEDYELQEYDVVHKERKKKKPLKKMEWVFERVHPIILFSGLFFLAVIEILFYFQVIQLAEAGGMFFLMISAEMLGNRFWKSKKEKKKTYRTYEAYEEEELYYEKLQDEMYQKEEEDIGETCCLTAVLNRQGLRLVHVAGETGRGLYPDICLEKGVLFVGKRKGESDVILDSPTVSRMHARLEARDGQYFVKDLNSRNGTFCNDQKLHPQEQREISAGDRITFAQIEYRAVRL